MSKDIEGKDIEVARAGGAQILRLNRPEKKNALTRGMYAALVGALTAGEVADGISAHVIFGLPDVFCAGNDIADFLALASGNGNEIEDVMKFIFMLPVLKKPLLAGVSGIAVGIGTTMLFHCDLVYAAPNAVFSTPFLDLGLVPEAASSLLAPRLVGPQRAFELLVLGAPLSVERAREAGLVNEIVPAAQLEEKVLKVAAHLARKPPEALAIARRLLRGKQEDIVDCMTKEAQLFKSRLKSPEAREAFQAFLEKRPPDFSKAKAGV